MCRWTTVKSTDVGQEQDLEQMLSRQDPRDAVVSVDPPALVEAAEQVNTDLTIGRGVGNAESSAKRAVVTRWQ